ncbi:MAG: M48 family metallopeptidase [Nitrospinota bacterium]
MYGKIAALLLVLVLSGCGAAPKNLISSPAAHPQFQRTARTLIGYQKLVCQDCKPNDWKIGIMRSDKINAASGGGGFFYVTEGALQLPDDELDAMIAHEVAHEIAGHNAKRQLASVAVTGVFMVLGAFVPGAGYLNHLANPLVTRAYSRENELEADSIAAALMEKRHGSIGRARNLMTFLEGRSAARKAKGEEGTGLFDTHPHPEERIVQLRKIIGGSQKAAAIPSYSRAETQQAGQEAADQPKNTSDCPLYQKCN